MHLFKPHGRELDRGERLHDLFCVHPQSFRNRNRRKRVQHAMLAVKREKGGEAFAIREADVKLCSIIIRLNMFRPDVTRLQHGIVHDLPGIQMGHSRQILRVLVEKNQAVRGGVGEQLGFGERKLFPRAEKLQMRLADIRNDADLRLDERSQ